MDCISKTKEKSVSVFKIQQAGVVTDNELGNTQQTLEKDNAAEAKPETTTSPAVTPEEGKTSEGKKADVMVKIDGPVGRIFTDALNKLLVKESYMTAMPLQPLAKDTSNREPVEMEPAVQVYAWHADELNLSDVVEITNDISKHTERDYVIAVESSGKVTREMGLLDQLGKMKNVKICFSQERALAALMARIKQ